MNVRMETDINVRMEIDINVRMEIDINVRMEIDTISFSLCSIMYGLSFKCFVINHPGLLVFDYIIGHLNFSMHYSTTKHSKLRYIF